MPQSSGPGRAFASRRAVLDIVRAAVLGCYGVTGFADRDLVSRLFRRFGLGRPAIELSLHREIRIDLYLTIAHGLPVAEVARQVESAVRYAVRRAFGREVARLVVHVNGLRVLPRRLGAHRPDATATGDGGDDERLPRPIDSGRGSRVRTAFRRRAAGEPSSPR